MAVIELQTFRLADGADEAAFLEADRRVQTEFIPNLYGFARRTTARGDSGTWLVVVLWYSADAADAAAALEDGHPAARLLAEQVDPASVVRVRYETLD